MTQTQIGKVASRVGLETAAGPKINLKLALVQVRSSFGNSLFGASLILLAEGKKEKEKDINMDACIYYMIIIYYLLFIIYY